MVLRRGALLFFKVIRQILRLKKLLVLTRIGRFRTVTPIWIDWWLWNDAQSLKQHRRGALSFFKVIRQLSRSHKKSPILTRNERFRTEIPVLIHWWLWFHKAWSSIEEVTYCFLAATKQLFEWFSPFVCLSVCLSVRPSLRHTFLTMFPSLYHHEISGVITSDKSDVHAKGRGQRSRSQRSQPNLTVSGL